jgi:hypothetical protein
MAAAREDAPTAIIGNPGDSIEFDLRIKERLGGKVAAY